VGESLVATPTCRPKSRINRLVMLCGQTVDSSRTMIKFDS
jgi:hypothetical protein